jgi:hypothetical protein
MVQKLCPITQDYQKGLNKTSNICLIFFIWTINKINYVLYDDIYLYYDKSPNFVELMLKNIYHKKGCVNKITNINFDNYEITFQKFGKKYKRCECKKQNIIWWFNRVLALQMKVSHFWKSCLVIVHFFGGLYVNWTFKISSIDLNHSL